ncbi:hypothetical protein [Frigoriflavimonas asaccharolytica]|uniref:Uncharacterized protein n=1 Tax=Frigoriflavimonas asaccharolytica TaxID=2735899 RepID=A0A8J8G8D4_9FLAO|nr:hypothetical protein [Frigoriflavimonas asaccharolytica]NRS91812.1 hypothetical protein [Frigoriflavimonas asaccharolytica]
MKITLKKIILFVVIIAIIVILPDIPMHYEKYKLQSQKLPEIYQSYREIYNLEDDFYEEIAINNHFDEPLLQINDSTVVIMSYSMNDGKDGGKDIEDTWYKIDLKGQIKDSLHYAYNTLKEDHHYKTVNNFIIDTGKNTFNTWLENGDPVWYSFNVIEEDKVFSKDEANEIIGDNKNLIESNYIYLGENGQDSKNKVIIFKDDQWFYFYSDKHWHESEGYAPNKFTAEYFYPVDEEPSIAPGTEDNEENKQKFYKIDDPKSVIHRVYSQKEEWIGKSFWHFNLRWGGNGNAAIGWTGFSYYDIKMPRSTLHFKQNVSFYLDDDSLRENFTYSYYKPKNGNYLILFDIQNGNCFLIRPKIR